MKPNVLVLKADGINCERETFNAFENAGGAPKIVHINQLISGEDRIVNYEIFVVPGGFSYGDDIASGKILAIEMVTQLSDQITEFVEIKKGLMLGICNGNQVLVRTGLFPFGNLGKMDAALKHNESGDFECRPVSLRLEENSCVFLQEMKRNEPINLMVACAEGNYYLHPDALAILEANRQVVFRYVDPSGNPTQEHPYNPSGSINAIAGITDKTGRGLVMMPHIERFTEQTQQTNWRRFEEPQLQGLPIARAMVDHARVGV